MDIIYKLCLIKYLKLDIDVIGIIKKLLFYYETLRMIKAPSREKIIELYNSAGNEEFVENNIYYSTNHWWPLSIEVQYTDIVYHHEGLDKICYMYGDKFQVTVDLTKSCLYDITLPENPLYEFMDGERYKGEINMHAMCHYNVL